MLERALDCRLHPPWRASGAAPCVRQADHARAAQASRVFVATADLPPSPRNRQGESLCLPTTPCRTSPPSSARQTAPVGVERGHAHTYAPCVTVALVSKALDKRRRFDTAARALGDGDPLVNLVPIVDGYMACLSANCASCRAQNPVPEPDARTHDYPRTHLLELARELRRASAGRGLAGIGLVDGAWE